MTITREMALGIAAMLDVACTGAENDGRPLDSSLFALGADALRAMAEAPPAPAGAKRGRPRKAKDGDPGDPGDPAAAPQAGDPPAPEAA